MNENNRFKIEKASAADSEAVLALYHSLIGTAGCTWDEFYPSMFEINGDISRGGLYVIRDRGSIIAAAAYGREPEHESIGIWSANMKAPAGLFRIGVNTGYQRRGLATRLVKTLIVASEKDGFDGMILLVSKQNPGAFLLYQSLGFEKCGECVMYGMEWDCCQLIYGKNRKAEG